MGDSILGKDFKRKKKKVRKLSMKLDNENKELKTIFLKTVTKDYVNELMNAINISGNEKDKNDMKDFSEKYVKGIIEEEDMGLFQYLEGIYRERM